MKKKLLALLLALTMLTLPILVSAEETAVTPMNEQSFNKFYADTIRNGMTITSETSFSCDGVEAVTEILGLSDEGALHVQAVEDLLNALTITEQTAMNGGSMTVNISGTDVFTVSVEAVDGVLYISSDLSDSMLAVDANAIPELINAITGSALEESKYIPDVLLEDVYDQITASAADGLQTLNQAMLEDDSAADQTLTLEDLLTLFAKQFPNTVAWIEQRVADSVSQVTEQPEGCDPAAVCVSFATNNAVIQDMKSAYLMDVLANEDRLEAVSELVSVFTGNSADSIVRGMQEANRIAMSDHSQDAPGNEPRQLDDQFDASKINNYDADLGGQFTMYMDEQGDIVKASWAYSYNQSDLPMDQNDLSEESSDLTLKLDYARNTEGDTVKHTLDITALVLGNEFAGLQITADATNGATRVSLDCHADARLMGTTVFSADLNAFTDANDEAGLSITWPDSDGQTRGAVFSSAWTVDVAPTEDVAAQIAWTGSIRGLNTEPLEAIHITYTVTDDPFSIEGKENALVLSATSGKELEALADEYIAGAMQCTAKTMSALPESAFDMLVSLMRVVTAY